MKKKVIVAIVLANLLTGCVPVPKMETSCYNGTSYTGEKTVYKRMVDNVYFIKSNHDKYMNIEIIPFRYKLLYGNDIKGKFLNAKLTLINHSNQKIVSNCNSLTYKAYGKNNGTYNGILPSFQCNDDKLTLHLDSFIRNSNFIQGKLTFDVFTRFNVQTYVTKDPFSGKYKKEPYLQSNNIVSFKLEKKDILNYITNGLTHGSEGSSCINWKPYSEILAGKITIPKLSHTDRKTKITLLKKPQKSSKLMIYADMAQLKEAIRIQATLSLGEASGKYGGWQGIERNKVQVKALMKQNCEKFSLEKKRQYSHLDIYEYALSNCLNLSFEELN